MYGCMEFLYSDCVQGWRVFFVQIVVDLQFVTVGAQELFVILYGFWGSG